MRRNRNDLSLDCQFLPPGTALFAALPTYQSRSNCHWYVMQIHGAGLRHWLQIQACANDEWIGLTLLKEGEIADKAAASPDQIGPAGPAFHA